MIFHPKWKLKFSSSTTFSIFCNRPKTWNSNKCSESWWTIQYKLPRQCSFWPGSCPFANWPDTHTRTPPTTPHTPHTHRILDYVKCTYRKFWRLGVRCLMTNVRNMRLNFHFKDYLYSACDTMTAGQRSEDGQRMAQMLTTYSASSSHQAGLPFRDSTWMQHHAWQAFLNQRHQALQVFWTIFEKLAKLMHSST